MKKLNFEEIRYIIENYLSLESFADNVDYCYNSFELNFNKDSEIKNIEELLNLKFLSETKKNNFDWENFNKQICNLLGLGEFVRMDSYGGEGQGDDYWSVVYFKDHNIYVKFEGWYSSANGHEWSDMSEVKPKQVMMTIYK